MGKLKPPPKPAKVPTKNPTKLPNPNPDKTTSDPSIIDDPVFDLDLSESYVVENVSEDDPLFGGTKPHPGQLYVRAKSKTGRCVLIQPKNLGNKRMKTKVIIASDVQWLLNRLWSIAYKTGFDTGVATYNFTMTQNPARQTECNGIERARRWLDSNVKQKLLSQDPSFPRKKSITGVTRIGRRSKGPG